MKQRAFLIISSFPSLKNIAQNFKPLILAESPYFHAVWYFYLSIVIVAPHRHRRRGDLLGRLKTTFKCQPSRARIFDRWVERDGPPIPQLANGFMNDVTCFICES